MRSILKCIPFFLFVFDTKAQTSINSFPVDSIVGSAKINFSSFKEMKILIVSTASQDNEPKNLIK